jgi:hypothetical protein
MSSRSKIENLPPKARQVVEDKIISFRFSQYNQVSDELKVIGIDLSPEVLKRYGKKIAGSADNLIAASKLQALISQRMPSENARSLVILIDLESGNHQSFKSEDSIGEILSRINN